MLNQLNCKHIISTGPSSKLLFSLVVPVCLLIAYFGYHFFRLNSADWSHGFDHPFQGWDHLVTMLAVGIWAAQMRGKAIWLLPLAFVSIMSLGGIAGAAGISIPSTEGIILLSCAVFSVLITRKIRFSHKVNVLIVAFFAFFHGFAHGQEISTSASLASYTFGFILATMLLHGAGILVAKMLVLTATFFISIFISGISQAHNHFDSRITGIDLAASEPLVANSDHFSLAAARNFANLYSCLNHFNQCNTTTYTEHFPLQKIQHNEFGSALIVASHNPNNLSSVYIAPLHAVAMQAHKAAPDNCFYCPQLLEQHCATVNNEFFILTTFFEGVLNLISFMHYFPDINNTPGISFLSNGVGLNSPPSVTDDFPRPTPNSATASTTRSSKQFKAAYSIHNPPAAHIPSQHPLPKLKFLFAENALANTYCKHFLKIKQASSAQTLFLSAITRFCLSCTTTPTFAPTLHNARHLLSATLAIEKPPPISINPLTISTT